MTRPLPPDLANLLDEATREVASDAVAPANDLWPAIASGITLQRQRRRKARLRKVAGLAAVVLVAVVTLSAPRTPPTVEIAAGSPAGSMADSLADSLAEAPSMRAPDAPPALATAVADLRADLGDILAAGTLPASAQAAIQGALHDLAQERHDLDQALQGSPDDANLIRQRADLDAREATLLHRLHRLARRA